MAGVPKACTDHLGRTFLPLSRSFWRGCSDTWEPPVGRAAGQAAYLLASPSVAAGHTMGPRTPHGTPYLVPRQWLMGSRNAGLGAARQTWGTSHSLEAQDQPPPRPVLLPLAGAVAVGGP